MGAVSNLPGDGDENFNPFGGFGGLGGFSAEGLGRFLSMFGAGGTNWDQARSAASAIATEGHPDPNVDPIVRMNYEQLARVAELQIARVTGLSLTADGRPLAISPVNRGQFARMTVDDLQPLFEKLAGSLGRMMTAQLDQLSGEDLVEMSSMLPPGMTIDFSEIMKQASAMIGPIMLVTLAGSTAGQLGGRAFGSYDLPIPRRRNHEVLVVATSIDRFGEEWSLPLDDLRLHVCLSEMTTHAVLSIPHVAERLESLLSAHADGFEADPEEIGRRFEDVDLSDPASVASLQSSMMNPEFMLNAIRSPRQRELVPQIDAITSCVTGYVDWVVDTISSTMLGEPARIAEALRRRRVETDEASRFVERLFGLELTREKCDRGTAFIEGVVERAGAEALTQLWTSVDNLPTHAELDAPGLWLARVGIEGDQSLPELDEPIDIPDFPDFDA